MVGTAVTERPGWLLEGRYRLGEPIAAGGMGEVWRATDLVLGRPVAVKLLRPGYGEHEDDLARFRAEARHAGSLSHPGIAQVYDYREADPQDPPYLVMELVDGSSLARLLDERQRVLQVHRAAGERPCEYVVAPVVVGPGRLLHGDGGAADRLHGRVPVRERVEALQLDLVLVRQAGQADGAAIRTVVTIHEAGHKHILTCCARGGNRLA